jgi:hypothetical protein
MFVNFHSFCPLRSWLSTSQHAQPTTSVGLTSSSNMGCIAYVSTTSVEACDALCICPAATGMGPEFLPAGSICTTCTPFFSSSILFMDVARCEVSRQCVRCKPKACWLLPQLAPLHLMQ